MNVSCSGVVQHVGADEMPQLTSAAGVAAVVTDRQAVEYSTVDSSSIAPVDDALEDSSMLTAASCLPPEDTAVPEPALTVDADHAQNCTSGGTFTGSWLFLYSLYASVPLWLFITRTVFSSYCFNVIYTHLLLCTGDACDQHSQNFASRLITLSLQLQIMRHCELSLVLSRSTSPNFFGLGFKLIPHFSNQAQHVVYFYYLKNTNFYCTLMLLFEEKLF